MLRILSFLSLCLLPLLSIAQEQDKSIWFAEKKYTDHSLLKFRTIRNRDLPFTAQLNQFAPLPQSRPDSINNKKWLLAYYTTTIQQAFQTQYADRAVLTDILAPQKIASYEAPEKAYRLFYSRTRRSDKIKYIRYAISKGLPVLVGFDQQPDSSVSQGESTWNGEGKEGTFRLLIVGYDSPTASFHLVSDQGPNWGYQGSITMTYLDLLAKAKEVLCLENPASTSKPKAPEKLEIPIQLKASISVKKLYQSQEKDSRLKEITAEWDGQAQLYTIKGKEPAKSDDRYQLELKLPKGRCTYIFAAQPDGTTTPVWMLEYNPQDTTVILPPVSYYQFPDKGKHAFFILTSYQPVDRWRRYVDRYEFNEQKDAPQKKLYQVLKSYLLLPDHIEYSKNHITAQSEIFLLDEKAVLPIIIEWDVKE